VNKIKKYRQLKGITQSKMAQELNITSDYLSMLERGVRTPSLKLAMKISIYLNSSLDEIFFVN